MKVECLVLEDESGWKMTTRLNELLSQEWHIHTFTVVPAIKGRESIYVTLLLKEYPDPSTSPAVAADDAPAMSPAGEDSPSTSPADDDDQTNPYMAVAAAWAFQERISELYVRIGGVYHMILTVKQCQSNPTWSKSYCLRLDNGDEYEIAPVGVVYMRRDEGATQFDCVLYLDMPDADPAPAIADQPTPAWLTDLIDEPLAEPEPPIDPDDTNPVPTPTAPGHFHFTGLPGAKKVLRDFDRAYWKKHGQPSIVNMADRDYVRRQGRSYYVARENSDSPLYFERASVLMAWLDDYLSNGRPNMAMLRQGVRPAVTA